MRTSVCKSVELPLVAEQDDFFAEQDYRLGLPTDTPACDGRIPVVPQAQCRKLRPALLVHRFVQGLLLFTNNRIPKENDAATLKPTAKRGEGNRPNSGTQGYRNGRAPRSPSTAR